MRRKFVSFTLSLVMAGSFLLPNAAFASWGASQLPSTKNPSFPNTKPPGEVSQPAPKPSQFQSIAEQIRYLREQKLKGQGEVNNPGRPENPSNPMPPDINPPPTKPEAPKDTNVLTEEAAFMVKLVNEEREKKGLKPLIVHPGLMELAKLKSIDMLQNNYFSHISPTYGSFANMAHNHGISFRSVGENIAQGRNGSHAHILFMASLGHRDNILSKNFTHIGIGVVQGPYGVYVTQLFIMQ